jgi:hypothetical protein
MIGEAGFECGADVTRDALAAIIDRAATPEMRSRMNGGIAKQLLDFAKETLDDRLDEAADDALLCLFCIADFEKAAALIGSQWARFTQQDGEVR